MADGVACIDGKHARTGHHQLVLASRRGLGKRLAHGPDGLCLRIRVRTRGGGLGQQHRALAVARRPGAGVHGHALPGIQLCQHRGHFAGGIARQQRLGEEPGGRGQQLERFIQRLRQAAFTEALRRDRGAEQVAVRKHVLAVCGLVDRLAVLDRREARVPAQLCRHGTRYRGAAIGIAAFDPDQDQARYQSVAQLVHQQLLLGAGQPRQEGREVGREGGAADDGRAGEHGEDPQCQREPARRWAHRCGRRCAHGWPAGRIFITERSPSACRISTRSSASWLPSMRTWLITAAMRESAGVSVSVQRLARPSRPSL
ncbi:hypothetical protein D9M72_189660 [compost metagenome]